MTLSSAYSATMVLGCVGWSAEYKLWSVGEKTAPCGTPVRIGEMKESSDPNLTAKNRSLRYDLRKR